MGSLLLHLGTLCGPVAPTFGGLLLAGLAGGPAHCAPMCGGFVLAQVSDRMARLPAARLCESARLRGALLLPYHAGRLATYSLLGAGAGTLGRQLAAGGLGGALLLLAAALFALQAVARVRPGLLPALPAAPAGWLRVLAAAARRVPGGLPLGLLLGLLPCGLLYAALAAAAATGDPARGALGMLAFGLGTVPGLFAVGLAGHLAGRRWRGRTARLAPAVLLANAALLVMLGLQRIVDVI
ncbi:MAG: sulfite exporter TauE/SafE family protein [Rhodospirillales bacterium]|nr:sulfite exporter TauE/SafE family protein [Rhodospirillales bacterium]